MLEYYSYVRIKFYFATKLCKTPVQLCATDMPSNLIITKWGHNNEVIKMTKIF